jgi:hypothetical protein
MPQNKPQKEDVNMKSYKNTMPLRSGINTLKTLSLSLALVALSACGKDPNPTISIQVGSLQASNKWMNFLVRPAYAANVSSVRLCFKRLRFKTAENMSSNSTDAEDNIDIALGEVEIVPGAELGEVTIPAGEYRRVEFDLDSTCASGKSASYQLGGMTYASTATITVKFEGRFDASQSGQKLELGFGAIINALDSLPSNPSSNQIRDALEDASVKGSF